MAGRKWEGLHVPGLMECHATQPNGLQSLCFAFDQTAAVLVGLSGQGTQKEGLKVRAQWRLGWLLGTLSGHGVHRQTGEPSS